MSPPEPVPTDKVVPRFGPPRVLLPTDFTPSSEEAAWLALRIPYRAAPEVTLMHVVSVPSQPTSLGTFAAWPEIVAKLNAEAATGVADAAESFRAMAKHVRTVVRRGVAADQILAESAAGHSDLIVMGAVGRSALERVLLGSVSDAVATHAGCSVLVARRTGRNTDDASPLRALVAVDETEESRRAVREIGTYRWGRGAEITLLHIMETYGMTGPGVAKADPDLWQELKEASRSGLERLAEPLRETGASVTVDVRAGGHVGREIERRAKVCRADVIAVGDRSRPTTFGLHLGSVSRHVLRQSDRSVWICRGRRA